MRGIVRAGRSFGMVLDGEYWKRLMAHALNAAVVKVNMSYLNVAWKTISEHCEAVIV